MPGNLQPLVDNQKIVTTDGLPTQYFIRWAQQRQIDITGGITAAEAQVLIDDWAAARTLIAGVALHGGGDLSADRTIDHDDSLVTPGTYGTSTKVPRFVVDAQGHIQGVTEVTISGGGGGGLVAYYFKDDTVVTTPSTPATVTAFVDLAIPADSVDRVFLVSGNITWMRSHPMRGSVMLDYVRVWPNDTPFPSGSTYPGTSEVNGGDGMEWLAFTGVLVTVPGDSAAHTISLGWEASASLAGLTVQNRHLAAIKIA